MTDILSPSMCHQTSTLPPEPLDAAGDDTKNVGCFSTHGRGQTGRYSIYKAKPVVAVRLKSMMAINDRTLLGRAMALIILVSLGGCGDVDARLYDRYRQRLAIHDATDAAIWCATGRRPLVLFEKSYQSRDEACRASSPPPEPPRTVYVEPPPDPPFPAPVQSPVAEAPSDLPIVSAPEPPRQAVMQSRPSPLRIARSTPIPGRVVALCNAECPDSPIDTSDQDPHAVLEHYRTLSCRQSCTYRELPPSFPNREAYGKSAEETLDQITKLNGNTASPASP